MCTNHRNPIRCIIPPYISKKLEDKQKVSKEEFINNQLRNFRLRSDRKFFSSLSHRNLKLMAVKTVAKPKPKPVIAVHSCAHGYSLPGKLVTVKTSKDKDVKNVYKGAMETWDFYYTILNRNSIDNAGLPLVNSVHYGKRYDNAMWNGRQMVYGDGDKKAFGSFTLDLDIIGHELTHGVTQFAANLDYENQPGALNESFSDVFGILIKQRALNQSARESDWLIGKNVMLGDKYALRSMKAPGTAYRNHPTWGNDPQPATMDDYQDLPNTEDGDYGGVHYNSGIPNHAFYLAAYELGGNAWEKVGKVWYAALTQSLQHDSDFADAKKATIAQAGKLFGKGSLVEKAVKMGWHKVKV